MDQRQKYQEQIGTIQKTLHHWWKKKIANLFSEIDDYVKHIFREQNQIRRITGPMWEPKDRGKLLVTGKVMLTHGKAVKGLWDGSCKDNGESGCGVVIKAVDRERWVTISRIAVLLSSHGGRNNGCVLDHENPGSDFPQMSVCP